MAPTDDTLADIARLADGTLPAARRDEVLAGVAADPALRRALDAQIAVARASAAENVHAPERLRDAVAAQGRARSSSRGEVAGAAARPRHRRARLPRWTLAPALGVAAAAVLALVLVLSGGAREPSVADAAALGTEPPTRAAPAPVLATPTLLARQVEGVPFPNFQAKFGWVATGARNDAPHGRVAKTVFYRRAGERIAYTILAGRALERPPDARVVRRAGVEYRAFTSSGRTVVTWLRGGHTCVLSGAAVPAGELLALASWRGKGSIPF